MNNCFILLIAILCHQPSNVKNDCIDNNGRTVQEGKTYIPGPEICTRCVCDNSVAKWCHPVLCTPPQDCKSYTTVGNICCEFNCLDETLKGDNINARSIASTVTAFLFFILIVFLINRLHKRNIMSSKNKFVIFVF
ncbi:PREDICTED: integral membrane protein DGCR2/IDD-like [Diuraphis noxia]|uniref:integral membrane protein DGCR2/IDD-like n=1 Tax=Diuraphis noxia TaxID=143948 RepID=UPI0007639495|nr:PREDICTED: integral membrane protein DGCR2/IDD-like [Diuraphis noxia]